MLFVAAPLHAGVIPVSIPVYTAVNWAGYAVGSLSSPVQDSVTGVGGSWIVPTATVSPNASASQQNCVIWVGIDGFNNGSVEQVGTSSSIENGVPSYYAWVQLYGSMTTRYDVPIKPGDSITASVKYGLPDHLTDFQLILTDNTTGQSFTDYGAVDGAPRSSAEWIVEPPRDSVGGTVLPLPTFGSATFTDAWATIGGATGTIGAINDPAWQAQLAKINMKNPAYGDAMTTSGLTTVGSGTAARSSFDVSQPVPEPGTLSLLGVGVFVLGIAYRRKRDCKLQIEN